jgi:serine/threonine-protein kinase
MVQDFVPSGSFLMGSADTDGAAYSDEKPQHTVELDAFWIDQTLVTNGQYALCVAAGACKAPLRFTSNVVDHYYGSKDYAEYPVLYVGWTQAATYCAWAGRQLPTEAEWEKAARGTDGRIYPWGNTPPEATLANFADTVKDVTRVGSYPAGASPYGALDMAGNAWQWVADWFTLDYYAASPAVDPTGPQQGTLRVVRGGSYTYDAAGIRSAYRSGKDPDTASYDLSFRCASSATP